MAVVTKRAKNEGFTLIELLIVVAIWGPARRAMRVDPLVAMQEE
jgi:prepilin-type N-terminal cleavage/methylation domain-containing protein